MSPFKPFQLTTDYWLDADDRQWILRQVRRGKGNKALIDPRLKTFGGVRVEPVGYFPSLPSLLRAMAERRLRHTAVEDWEKVVEEMDKVQAKVTRLLSKALVPV